MSSLKKEFSKETKIVKKIKAFIRGSIHVEEHTGRLRVSYLPQEWLMWGQFSGLSLANHLHIWSWCGWALAVKMDSNWHLSLSFGPSPTRRAVSVPVLSWGIQPRPSAPPDIPSQTIGRRPVVAAQPGAYLCLTSIWAFKGLLWRFSG